MTTTILIAQNFDGGHEIKVQSRETDAFKCVIESLKTFVSAAHRTYCPDAKLWTVNESGYRELIRWTNYCQQNIGAEIKWLPEADDESEDEPPRHRQPKIEAFATLHLLPTACPELVKSAFRILARQHHPDHGGSTEAMQKINKAYNEATR